jgi:hypothetical protein
VQSLLRPSERLILVLEGSYLPHGEERDSDASPPISSGDINPESSSEETRVILAIVEHVNHAMGESGRLILDASAHYPTLNTL